MGVDRTSRRAAPTSSNNNPFDDDDDDNNGGNSSLTTGNGPSSAAVSGGRAHSRQPTANAGNNKQGFITNGTPTGGTITVAPPPPPHDPMLDHYESKLQQTVDADFFNDPQTFTALDRVISIISAEITLSGGNITPGSTIATNFNHLPQYQAMEAQGKIVEEAIEHMAIRHCADLNSSVAAVGRMSRQFDEAKIRVRNLRRQVNDVKDSLRLGELNDSGGGGGGGIVMASDGANPNEPSNNAALQAAAAAQAGASARSLRELWLKKLECEAVLSLLRKLEIIRRAPSGFDTLIRPLDGGPCKIGAAVVVLSEALSIMFSDDVAMVQAFDRIVEQLMTRKQRAEEVLWATLVDVLYRHGDGTGRDEERKRRERMERRARAIEAAVARGDQPANIVISGEYSDEDDSDSCSNSHTDKSYEDDNSTKSGGKSSTGGSKATTPSTNSGGGSTSTSNIVQLKRMVGRAILESDIDLENDELRCLEEPAAWGTVHTSSHTVLPASFMYPEQALPRYTDPVLALRILVECLTKLKRLDDVEQYLSEGLDREIRQVAMREQAKTVARLERQRGRAKMSVGEGEVIGGESIRGAAVEATENLKEFRIHLNNLLKAFGGVMTRFLHLAQILRHKICSDPNLEKMCPSYPIPSSALFTVLANAELAMQREIKLFISACIAESDKPKDLRRQMRNRGMDQTQVDVESGIFSLGITSSLLGGGPTSMEGWKKSRANVVDLPPDQFVSNFLIPRTNVDPEVRHALTFRRNLSQWTHELTEGRKELAICSGEDTSSPMYRNTALEDSALVYVDNIIQKTLLPEMQDEAVNAVIHFLERHDAFDPIASDVFTRYQHNAAQVEAEMSVACQALYTSTRPIFMALHRLPKGGDMVLSLVTMLEHAMLTFISRMKQRVGEVCQGKAAISFLEDKRGNPTSLGQYMERRNAFTLLQRIYNDEDDVDDSTGAVDPNNLASRSGIAPLAPSESDTSPRKNGKLTGADGRGTFEKELTQISVLTKFKGPLEIEQSTLCTDEELMKAACLANSLLRVASLLDGQLRSRGDGWDKSQKIKAVRDLQSAIKTIRFHGLRVAKFCRMEMLIQTAKRMSEICTSTVLQAEDAVRLPSCVNNLGEYLTSASDNIREAGGNAIAAYSFSSLEQYIPYFLMHSARLVVGSSKSVTMNGIVALDRTGSVLYRDLKGATSFENSFWDEEAAANSFEQSAVFISLMEISLNDLESHYRSHPTQFADEDFQLMFSFSGPRRRGDLSRYSLAKSKVKT